MHCHRKTTRSHIQCVVTEKRQGYTSSTHPVHSHRKKTRSHTRCTVTERRPGHTPGAQSQKEDTAMGGKRSAVRVPQEKATVNEFDQLPRSRLPSIAWSSVRQLPTCVRAQRQDEPSGHCGAGTQHLTWYTGTRIPHMTWYTGTRIHHLTWDSGTRIPHWTWDSGASVPHLTWKSYQHTSRDVGQWNQNLI